MADPFTIAPSKIIQVGDPIDRTPPATVRISPPAPVAGLLDGGTSDYFTRQDAAGSAALAGAVVDASSTEAFAADAGDAPVTISEPPADDTTGSTVDVDASDDRADESAPALAIDPPDPLDPLVQDADITTAWFDPETKPVHQGVYQRRFPGGPYSCWDGAKWFGDAVNAARAATSDAPSPHQDIGWRGLVSPSAAPCPTCKGHGVVDFGVHEDTGDDLIAPCEDC